MTKRNRIEDSPEFRYFEEHFEEIMKEMENDPDLEDCKIPEEWDREFRKTIEDTLKEQKMKKRRKIYKMTGLAASVALVVTLGLGFTAEKVEGRGLVEFFQNIFDMDGKQYTVFDVGEEVDIYEEENAEDIYFDTTTLDETYRQIREELKVPMFYVMYIPENYDFVEAKYNKEYKVLNLEFDNGKDSIHISQQQQFDEITSGIINEEESLTVINDNINQEIVIYQSSQDDSLSFSTKQNQTFLVVRCAVSVEECKRIVESIEYH